VIGTEALRSDERPSPQDCPPDMARAAAAQRSLKKVGYGRSQADVVQACVRPMSPDGVPIVGKLFGNVYVATGGGPWGITWGPLMGKSLASLINDDDDPPIRLGPLKPERFDTLIYQQLLKSRAPETKVS
jgi:glycine/D-amino acid oxidase-like deaminating enzyme